MSDYSSDPLNSTPTNSISFDDLRSPRSDLSSSFENSISSMYKWKRTPEKRLSHDQYDEYGQVENLETDEPFVIKFNSIAGGQIVCQLDDFLEVPVSDAIRCLDCLTDQRVSANSLEIEINASQARVNIAVFTVLSHFEKRRQRCPGVTPIQRLLFFAYDFRLAKEAAGVVARLAPRAVELNIGIAKRNVYALPPTEEASYVAEFLKIYLTKKETCDNLRVLRVYNFIALTSKMLRILEKCSKLCHITLSNIDEISSVFELPSVESVLLDSCHYSITMFEDSFADKHPRLFPNATTFGFLRSPVELAVRALRQWGSERIGDSRREIRFYQPDRDFRRFLFETSRSYEVVNDEKELEGEVQIRGHGNGALITVLNKDRVFKTSIDF